LETQILPKCDNNYVEQLLKLLMVSPPGRARNIKHWFYRLASKILEVTVHLFEAKH